MNPLKTISGTIIGGVVLAVIIMLATKGNHMVAGITAQSVTIWLHVLSGITRIGLLYYFNLVQAMRVVLVAPASLSMSRRAHWPGSAGPRWPHG